MLTQGRRAVTDQCRDPLAHLVGGLVGESYRQDLAGAALRSASMWAIR